MSEDDQNREDSEEEYLKWSAEQAQSELLINLAARNARLRVEVEKWKERYQAERDDHLATIRHCDEELERIKR